MQRAVVVEKADFGAFRGRSAFDGFLLHEVADGPGGFPRRLHETSVEGDGSVGHARRGGLLGRASSRYALRR